jgi:hypothetical protein
MTRVLTALTSTQTVLASAYGGVLPPVRPV